MEGEEGWKVGRLGFGGKGKVIGEIGVLVASVN